MSLGQLGWQCEFGERSLLWFLMLGYGAPLSVLTVVMLVVTAVPAELYQEEITLPIPRIGMF